LNNEINYYAVRRKKDGVFVAGTDFNYMIPRSILADEYSPPLILTDFNVEFELNRRCLSKRYYEVVKVKVVEI